MAAASDGGGGGTAFDRRGAVGAAAQVDVTAIPIPLCSRRNLHGYPKHARVAVDAMGYAPLSDVLTEDMPSDAHFAAYSRPDLPARLTNEILDHPDLGAGIPMVALVFDIDYAPSHKSSGAKRVDRAPDWWFEQERPKIKKLLARMPGAVCYRTKGGYRIVYVLPLPFIVRDQATKTAWALFYVRCCCLLFREFEIEADPRCADWTRMYRMPHATRDEGGRPEDLETIGDPSAVGMWTYDPACVPLQVDIDTAAELASRSQAWAEKLRTVLLPRPPRKRGRKRTNRLGSPAVARPSQNELVQALVPIIEPIDDGRHDLYLSLAGALCQLGVPLPEVEAVVYAVAVAAGDAKATERLHDAQTTTAAFAAGRTITGLGTLATNWPEVAAAVSECLGARASVGFARMQAEFEARSGGIELSVNQAFDAVRAALSDAKDGEVIAFRTGPGVGKTQAAAKHAASAEERVAIVLPTNHLVDVVAHLSASTGADTASKKGRRASVRCRHAALASRLEAAGLSVPRHLCANCKYRAACGLRTPSANLMVTNHALLQAAIEHVGEHGLLIIDEGPALFDHVELGLSDLDVTLRALSVPTFHRAFAQAVQPFVKAVHAAMVTDSTSFIADVRRAAQRRGVQLENIVEMALAEGEVPVDEVVAGDSDPWLRALAAFQLASSEIARGAEPPFRRRLVRSAMMAQPVDFPAMVQAARCLKTLARIFGMSGERSSTTWEVEGDETVIKATFVNRSLEAALRRSGPTVLLDATFDAMAVQRLVAPRSVAERAVDVADAASMSRVVVYWGQSTRRWTLPNGGPDWGVIGPVLAHGIRLVREWDARIVLVVAAKVIAEALRGHLTGAAHVSHPGGGGAVDAFALSGGRLLIAHFGNLRGRNEFDGVTWQALDAVLSLGDPIPNIGAMEAEAKVLGLDEHERDARIRSIAAAELAQAHGRLRAPRRTRPALSLHYGQIIPAGWHPGNARLEVLPPGRPPVVGVMSVDELAAAAAGVGGVAGLARASGISRTTLSDLIKGRRPISGYVASQVRPLVDAVVGCGVPPAGGAGGGESVRLIPNRDSLNNGVDRTPPKSRDDQGPDFEGDSGPASTANGRSRSGGG